ncbi:restriction endonuclease subunit S [Lentibacillus cibarius]|nr:restriction endonuclease subunit S [Lentibacillus cibarius]
MAQKNWNKQKLKRLFKIKNGGTPKSNEPSYWEPGEVKWITPEDLSTGNSHIRNSIRKISFKGLENSSATLVKAGSIVLSTRAPIGNVKIVKTPYATNQGCKSLEQNEKTDIRFFYYYLSINEEYLNQLGRGTTFLELSNSALKNLELSVPILPMQKAISDYLDQRTSEIDALVSDKERLIELLEEKRQAMITETVTKGLDPNVKMKDSGIEWIGEIPEHWEVSPLFLELAEVKHKNINLKEQNVLSLSYGRIIRRNVEANFGLIPASFNTYNIVNQGDIVMRLTDLQNDKRSLRVGYVTEKGIITSAYTTLSLSNNCRERSKYYYYLLHSYDLQKIYYGLGDGVRQTMNYKDLKWLSLLKPPKSELAKIVSKLDELDSTTKELIEYIRIQISKLKEYRESLIYEAVTGKIDVRDYATETEEVH